MLLFNSLGAVAGPALFVNLRGRSELAAMNELLTKVSLHVCMVFEGCKLTGR